MATENVENVQPKVDDKESVPVREVSHFGMDGIVRLTGLIIFGGSLCGLLVLLYLILIPLRSPSPIFFKVTANNQLIQDIPLDKPNLPTNILLNWVTESMMTVHTFNFVNYATAIADAKEYFTKEGYDSYTTALQNTKILDAVINQKYVLRAVPTASPQITKEGLLANFYLWKIQLPMLFRYRNVDTDSYDNVELNLLVMRVPNTDAPFGVRILQYNLTVLGKAGGAGGPLNVPGR